MVPDHHGQVEIQPWRQQLIILHLEVAPWSDIRQAYTHLPYSRVQRSTEKLLQPKRLELIQTSIGWGDIVCSEESRDWPWFGRGSVVDRR